VKERREKGKGRGGGGGGIGVLGYGNSNGWREAEQQKLCNSAGRVRSALPLPLPGVAFVQVGLKEEEGEEETT
jgi:hypothetical protein